MSAIYLTEDDVAWLLDMDVAIECIEESFRQWAHGKAENQPRRRSAAGGRRLCTFFPQAPSTWVTSATNPAVS